MLKPMHGALAVHARHYQSYWRDPGSFAWKLSLEALLKNFSQLSVIEGDSNFDARA